MGTAHAVPDAVARKRGSLSNYIKIANRPIQTPGIQIRALSPITSGLITPFLTSRTAPPSQPRGARRCSLDVVPWRLPWHEPIVAGSHHPSSLARAHMVPLTIHFRVIISFFLRGETFAAGKMWGCLRCTDDPDKGMRICWCQDGGR